MQNTKTVSWWTMSPNEARERINQRIMEIEAAVPQVGAIEDIVIFNDKRKTPIRIYKPLQDQTLQAILYIHGGNWVAGNLETHDNLARYLCREAQAVVISVDYTNAPEEKFPLQLEQCYDALIWMNEQNIKRIAIVGDSVGGNMATALCMMARDRQGPNIAMQVLINPLTNLTADNDATKWRAGLYLSNLSYVNHPYVSPLFAKDLSCLPEAVILLAEQDDLRKEGQEYANKLKAAGVPTFVYCQPDIGHLAGDAARASLRARISLDQAIKILRSETGLVG